MKVIPFKNKVTQEITENEVLEKMAENWLDPSNPFRKTQWTIDGYKMMCDYFRGVLYTKNKLQEIKKGNEEESIRLFLDLAVTLYIDKELENFISKYFKCENALDQFVEDVLSV